MDIAVGIVLAIATSKYFAFDLTLNWLLLGIGFALLPDIDVFIELYMRKGKLAGKELVYHREWTHYPLLYPFAVFIVYLWWGGEVAFLMALGLLWHTIHDSHGTGWGLVMFGPFSKKNYKLFSRKDGTFSWSHPLVVWEREELRAIVRELGNDNWVKDIYLRPSFTLIVEAVCLVLAILLLIKII